MAIRQEKTEQGYDIIVDGFEKGIAVSPHKGIGNIQNANISTEMGEVMNSFSRTQQTMTNSAATGSLSYLSTDHVNLSIPSTDNLFKGSWIAVTGSSNTGQLPNGTYFVPPSTGAGFKLANYYNAMNFIPTVSVASLVIAGGGSGGYSGNNNNGGGGGGAGGMVSTASTTVLAQAYPIVVGAGGTGSTGTGNSGANSTFSTITATGGGFGGGGTGVLATQTGANGGSGGGGGGQTANSAAGPGGTGSQGNNGGAAATGGGITAAGGGGGGAGTAGGAGSSSAGVPQGGTGGNGLASSITGASVTYAGGGGGFAQGSGGGSGAGGTGGGGGAGVSGTANLGSGGGGGGPSAGPAGSGGSGVVIISYATGTITATGGSITTSGGNTIHTFTTNGTFTVTAITPTVVPAFITGLTAGLTASFTMVATMGNPLAQATETYYSSGVAYHRYYVLDANNLVWFYDDQNETLYSSTDGVSWILPDFHTDWCVKASGIAVISGFLMGATEHGIFGKSVATLGNTNSTATTWTQLGDFTGWQGSARSTDPVHYCLAGHQGSLYITDNSYIVSIFPDAALADPGSSTAQNVQSFCSWTATDANNGLFSVISGTTPVVADLKRVPAVFFTVNNGVLPYAITAGTVYYIGIPTIAGTFEVFAASTGGSALDIQTGANGVQYFNTFYPIASASNSLGATPTYVLTSPQVALPTFEQAQCLAEIGTTVLIGCKGNVVYPWNQQATQATTIISLPESNVTNILTVNQMGYIFAGNKGNIYITDGSTASLVTTVPDYCAGVPGTPSSYIEPVYTWGGGAYVRGRVYFSILDQTATKAGNCGGVWSFVPTQNFYIGQDVGLALRLENQNSYGTYNGYAPLLISKLNQNVIAPQYWAGWKSDITTPTYGIDFTGTGTNASSVATIETDLMATGNMLSKKTFKQIEYKLSSPLVTNATIAIKYRQNMTDAWAALGTIESDNTLTGFNTVTFEKGQWLQLQVILTPTTASPGTFVRLTELRFR